MKMEEETLKLVLELSLKDENNTTRNKAGRVGEGYRNNMQWLAFIDCLHCLCSHTKLVDIATAFSPHIRMGKELLDLASGNTESCKSRICSELDSPCRASGSKVPMSTILYPCSLTVPLLHDKTSKATKVQELIQMSIKQNLSQPTV